MWSSAISCAGDFQRCPQTKCHHIFSTLTSLSFKHQVISSVLHSAPFILECYYSSTTLILTFPPTSQNLGHHSCRKNRKSTSVKVGLICLSDIMVSNLCWPIVNLIQKLYSVFKILLCLHCYLQELHLWKIKYRTVIPEDWELLLYIFDPKHTKRNVCYLIITIFSKNANPSGE